MADPDLPAVTRQAQHSDDQKIATRLDGSSPSGISGLPQGEPDGLSAVTKNLLAEELRAFVRTEVRLSRMTGHQTDSLLRFADRLVDELDRAYRQGAREAHQEVCVCAAVQTAEGRIFRGHRHDDALVTAGKAGYHTSSLADAQGFITSLGRYVNRAEGAKLQADAGIVSIRTQELPKFLFSEDLY